MLKTAHLTTSLFLISSAFAANDNNVNYYVIAKQAAPFQIETDNLHSGIVTDIIQAIFEDSNYKLHYHTYPFNRMISILENDDDTNWITYGSPGWGGPQAENLSDIPIYTVNHVLVSHSNSTFDFNHIEDIENKIIILLHGFDYPQLAPYLNQGKIEELRVKDYDAAFRVLQKLPEDTAFVEMESRINYNLKKSNKNKSQYNIQSFSNVIPNYPIYLAFSPNMDHDLQMFINKKLTKIKDNGQINKILDKYR